ncbi:fimbrial biogenesis chaperone [Persephonella sp.]
MRAVKKEYFKLVSFIKLIVIFLVLNIGTVYGLDFVVKPIRIYVPPNKNTAVFEIQSLTNKKIAIEAEIRKWDQDESGEDILVPTEEMVVVPPYIELEGKQKQLVRIAYVGGREKPIETFRLLLKQVPAQVVPEKDPKKVKSQIQIVLNLSIPVFIMRNTDVNYKLSINPIDKSKEKVTLLIKNEGALFARIAYISLFKDGKEIYSKRVLKYILPNKTIKYEFRKSKIGPNGKPIYEPFDEIPDKAVIVLEDETEFTINL